ncbi:TPM domain-containing protein [Pseudoduganella namucuonensis]|uniref:TLP18.3, Psb32 and MOLO-1 founding protein of phosphatase n=1 Tax=Pseudoduganella namucuonensis TaxID=1035707 RepID=A0A1I7IB04_9BURK|nr:TPM domain-containing protein [Pseudoduganella namucuonensis]SFU70117.1 TLP18.3, Psb32 and MOLO-1 founding protein of phosphatase [Pseudoduganella namucuonensis]
MDIGRLIKHLLTTRVTVRRRFPMSSLEAIKAAITESERGHRGEIRFAIEPALEPMQVLRGMAPRERAVEVFSELGVWDTEENSGVLIYVLYADHAIEIVADRGIHASSGVSAWERIASDMERAFAAGDYEAGALRGIAAVSEELRRHVPRDGGGVDELPDEVTLL